MATFPHVPVHLITLTIMLLFVPGRLGNMETDKNCYVDLAQVFFRYCQAHSITTTSDNFVTYKNPELSTWKIGLSRYIEININGTKIKDRKYYNNYQESLDDKPNQNRRDKPYKLAMRAYGHGLGNKMFMYASSFAVAQWNKMEFIYDNPRKEIESIFQPTARILHYEPNLTDSFLQLKTYTCCEFYPALKSLPPENIHLSGYLQSWRYLEPWEKDIRREFTFQDHIQSTARESLSNMVAQLKKTSENPTFIGLHVRRGDFTYDQNLISHGHKVADAAYIHRAMAYFKDRYPDSIFIVCSDEIPWCKKNIPDTDGNVVFTEESNPAYVDLAILSLCNHTIMTVGTFSWWAAWLAGGEATYYADWPQQGSGFEGSMNKSDYFLPHWIGL
ncbi:galactoside 2-alpha-L-fucosyltransferase 2-like [Lingula anatina]|uniref:L-Fucosyltransferase n=1 Tax=Lingula anatina TaxID=7574 RepID=A0A1S3JPI7_LINAN|nr:galactoside 2-alpha-L-fucosyltransferase 2-like [Lingula anatina]XP_023930415.1 galactoside 2-alpha-L-fucosyltransferase 2-like [Lingula anatina]XP_023930416.1 galactoside 2-alpha-L-fucosyltransferase 2-like [Lingula anatina]XP_023930417.1 galactoside 2-alpha-L-fucosyltransferase 2-like [Lingula anatina]XP_023930418.1 galactoside 2-alpha-L-fucosyltransferase 2-like [Lingula anatina]|eukprot:XP_013411914.2 galactoside 2-alpha-L-fucosyltransferase 2-like [Lingula anatina]